MPPPRRPDQPVVPKRSVPQEVRLMGGQFKRTPLPVRDWPGLRPTPSRVRETLFNWLGQDMAGWRVLDAFAGTGALGLEAASRGAALVVLIEQERVLAQHLSQVVSRLGMPGVTVHTADALNWMKRAQAGGQVDRFDLVMLDPPFGQDLFAQALAQAQPHVVVGGWIYLEADRPFGERPEQARRGVPLPTPQASDALPEGLRLHRFGQAGAVHYHLIERVG